VRELGFDDAFIRKWHYYLAYCEAGFDTDMIHVRQICYQKAAS
jgi:cyclopropane-fatty-acyl-phospholipid synthase